MAADVTPSRTTRATPTVLVRLQLKWEADRHVLAGLALPDGRQVEWRTLSPAQLSALDCADPFCVLVRDLLRRAHAAGRAAGLADAVRTMEAMVRPS
jgi:hypothetical protein